MYLIVILCSLVLLGGCKNKKDKIVDKSNKATKELIVYCENTMLNIVLDLKQAFEQQYDCTVVIQNDNSKNLMGIIQYSAVGDLYIPSTAHSFEDFYDQTGQQLTDSLFIGYNHLVFMVKKGNPKHFSGYSSQLRNKGNFAVILANAESSDLGYETKRFLKQQRIYDKVLKNAVSLTSDSKGLIRALKEDQADVVINWKSNLFVNKNRNYVDVIVPQSSFNTELPVYATVLSCSKEPVLARAFLKMASSHFNEPKLSQYGFSKRQTIIF